MRDHGLEMVFEQKGLANYRFFAGAKMQLARTVKLLVLLARTLDRTFDFEHETIEY